MYSITVRGKTKEWSFEFEGENHLDEWEADGLEVYKVVAKIPFWVAKMGLGGVWMFLQKIRMLPL